VTAYMVMSEPSGYEGKLLTFTGPIQGKTREIIVIKRHVHAIYQNIIDALFRCKFLFMDGIYD